MTEGRRILAYPADVINDLLEKVANPATEPMIDSEELITSGGVAQAIAQAKTDITSNLDDYYVADFYANDIFSGASVRINTGAITTQLDENKFFLVPYAADGGVCIAAGEYDEDSLRFSIYAPEGFAVVNAKLSSTLVTADMVSIIKFDDIPTYANATTKDSQGIVLNAYGKLLTVNNLPISDFMSFILDIEELGVNIISELNKRTNDIESSLETVADMEATVSANAKKLKHISESTSGVAGIANGQFGVIPNITTGELEGLFDDLKKSEFGIHAMRKLPPLVRQIEADYIQKTDDLENNKANIDGRYENMTSGFAENLTGRGDAISCSFTEQPTGGTLSIKNGVARFKGIYGNTMRFRQEWPNADFSNGVAPFSSASSLSVDNRVLRIRKNATDLRERTSAVVNPIANNRYYFSVEVRNVALSSGGNPYINVSGVGTNTIQLGDTHWHRIEVFGVAQRSLTLSIDAPAGMEEGHSIEVRNPQLFNISELGTFICPINNADEFRKMFPDDYYPYSEKHKLIHMGNDCIVTHGFNAAEQVSDGGYSAELLGGKTYYIGGSVNLKSITFEGEAVSLNPDMLFTPYKRGTLYCRGSNVCVNLHHSGYRDGEYQAFWRDERTIPRLAEIFPKGMKSLLMTYDELTEEYAVKRVEMVDMASLEWLNMSSGVYYARISGISASPPRVMCDIYTPATSAYTDGNGYDTLVDKTIYAYKNSAGVIDGVIIKDTNCPDLFQFIENIREGEIVYRLESEVKTRFREHEVSLDYIVDDFGTERVTNLNTLTTHPCAPMVANIVYDFNAVDEIRSNRNNIADLLARVEALEAAIATPIAEPIEEEL